MKMNVYIAPGAVSTIDKIVCDVFCCTDEELHSRSRKREVSEARNTAIYFCIHHFKMTYVKAGELYGRDHSTCQASDRMVRDLLKFDRTFRMKFEEVERRFTPLTMAKPELKIKSVELDNISMYR